VNVFEGWGWTKIGIIADCILDDLGVEHGDHLVEVMVSQSRTTDLGEF
jgi:hypothetical protein